MALAIRGTDVQASAEAEDVPEASLGDFRLNFDDPPAEADGSGIATPVLDPESICGLCSVVDGVDMDPTAPDAEGEQDMTKVSVKFGRCKLDACVRFALWNMLEWLDRRCSSSSGKQSKQ